MTLTPEEQALLDARRAMLAAGNALDAAYAALRSAIATGEAGSLVTEYIASLEPLAVAYDTACRTYDAAFRAAYDRRAP